MDKFKLKIFFNNFPNPLFEPYMKNEIFAASCHMTKIDIYLTKYVPYNQNNNWLATT